MDEFVQLGGHSSVLRSRKVEQLELLADGYRSDLKTLSTPMQKHWSELFEVHFSMLPD
ncbi:MAG: hypothetical protein ACI8Y7_000574 [Candidatus Woesearchaeota archaeon]|jgi:hypothetical protein